MAETICVRCKTTIESGGVQFKRRTYCDTCVDEFETIAENGVVVRSRHGKSDYDQKPYVVSGGGTQYIEHSQTAALARGQELTETHGCHGLFIYWRNGSHWDLETYLDAHPRIADRVEKERRKIRGQEPITADETNTRSDTEITIRAERDAIVDSTVVDDSVVNRSSIDGENGS